MLFKSKMKLNNNVAVEHLEYQKGLAKKEK